MWVVWPVMRDNQPRVKPHLSRVSPFGETSEEGLTDSCFDEDFLFRPTAATAAGNLT